MKHVEKQPDFVWEIDCTTSSNVQRARNRHSSLRCLAINLKSFVVISYVEDYDSKQRRFDYNDSTDYDYTSMESIFDYDYFTL